MENTQVNNKSFKRSGITLAVCLVLGFSQAVFSAKEASKPTSLVDARASRTEYSPYLDDTYPDNVYFGDTHLHTSYSTDASFFGNRLGPEEAYLFAKGEVVTSSLGVKTRLLRPLDFLVVADHAENLGLGPMIEEKNPMVMKHEWGKKVADLVHAGELGDAYSLWGAQVTASDDPFAGNTTMVQSMWDRIIKAAEKHNNPGQFTAFIGFEWTSSPGGSNMHRNVIFRDDGDKTSKILPMSSYDSEDPEDLWAYMDKYEKNTGGKALAIAHNGNLSNGLIQKGAKKNSFPRRVEKSAKKSAFFARRLKPRGFWFRKDIHIYTKVY
jgi:hypothetical protein